MRKYRIKNPVLQRGKTKKCKSENLRFRLEIGIYFGIGIGFRCGAKGRIVKTIVIGFARGVLAGD